MIASGQGHLLIGSLFDGCCLAVRTRLRAHGCEVRMLAEPLTDRVRIAWRLDAVGSTSRLTHDEGWVLRGEDIAAVLVRTPPWIQSDGWQNADLAYVQTETQAALLGWLWSLSCPVINRYPPLLWYQPEPPLLFWQPVLARCGLATSRALVTNDSSGARAFGADCGMGVVYSPLTTPARYLIATENDWHGLDVMQRCAPVCLTAPHGAVQLACVVGDQIVWDGPPPRERGTVETGLHRFAAAAGLDFVEVVLTEENGDVRVVAVAPQPHFERFGRAAQEAIADGLAGLLLAGRSGHHPVRADGLSNDAAPAGYSP